VIVASGIAMQFGAKLLSSDVSVKFGGGNRYGLIGANGCGKSTFMKILGGELEPCSTSIPGRLLLDGQHSIAIPLRGEPRVLQSFRYFVGNIPAAG